MFVYRFKLKNNIDWIRIEKSCTWQEMLCCNCHSQHLVDTETLDLDARVATRDGCDQGFIKRSEPLKLVFYLFTRFTVL